MIACRSCGAILGVYIQKVSRVVPVEVLNVCDPCQRVWVTYSYLSKASVVLEVVYREVSPVIPPWAIGLVDEVQRLRTALESSGAAGDN